jgi:ABC-2 type transport system permease protein
VNGLLYQIAVGLRLHFRNKMAMIYSYLFPTFFLIAFWVLYRYEVPPLVRHMGQLLTVTALGGACFGLPTTMVSERERGVWRRYRLTPVPTGSIVASTLAGRYLLLLIAGVIQLVLAMTLGMPTPRHPFDLWVAFTCVSFALMGLGLVLATMADNVPAVQALGQCIFLPMLIIGGVAVPLESLPDWAQRISSFFPGRYAVEAINACVTGDGLGPARFSIVALLLTGLAGCVAGARLFRWDAQQRFATIPGKAWVAVALVAWAAVGLAAETRRNTVRTRSTQTAASAPAAPAPQPVPVPEPAPAAALPATSTAPPPAETAAPAPSAPATTAASKPRTSPAPASPPAGAIAPVKPLGPPAPAPAAPSAAPPATPAVPAAAKPATSTPPWATTTLADIDREIDFTRLPPDDGVVVPIAKDYEEPEPEVLEQLETLRTRLPDWAPGKVPDLVQRARNLLYVIAVPDVLQTPIERFAPLVVFDRLQQDIPPAQLIQVLFWIALHPMDGDDDAIAQLPALGMNYGATDRDETRNRAAFYAVKLLGRMTGRIVPK